MSAKSIAACAKASCFEDKPRRVLGLVGELSASKLLFREATYDLIALVSLISHMEETQSLGNLPEKFPTLALGSSHGDCVTIFVNPKKAS